jgi:hypothetical protein
MKKSNKVYHLYIKRTREHKYYGSVAALVAENRHLGVGINTLYRFNFTGQDYENVQVIIKKAQLIQNKKNDKS